LNKNYNFIDTFIIDSFFVFADELNLFEPRLLQTTIPLILPKDLHIRLIITSDDVIHSYAIPAFGIKVDAVPGRLNAIPIFPKISGDFFGQCSELCGINHAFMPIEIKVVNSQLYYNLLLLKITKHIS
jgi:heme/copper-type cytochrome/quinol oxidase subunit 2